MWQSNWKWILFNPKISDRTDRSFLYELRTTDQPIQLYSSDFCNDSENEIFQIPTPVRRLSFLVCEWNEVFKTQHNCSVQSYFEKCCQHSIRLLLLLLLLVGIAHNQAESVKLEATILFGYSLARRRALQALIQLSALRCSEQTWPRREYQTRKQVILWPLAILSFISRCYCADYECLSVLRTITTFEATTRRARHRCILRLHHTQSLLHLCVRRSVSQRHKSWC